MNTVYGILCDADGLAAATGPELRLRTWATPAHEVRSVQADRIPIDLDHDGIAVGEIVDLQLIGSNLWAVGHVADSILPAVNVWVGDERVMLERDLYWSAMRDSTLDDRDIRLHSVSLTARSARVAARPVTFLPGQLDHRHVAAERWRLRAGPERELLTRAAANHLDRRRDGGPLIVQRTNAELRVRGRSVDALDWAERRQLLEDLYYGDAEIAPSGTIRMRPCEITAVR